MKTRTKREVVEFRWNLRKRQTIYERYFNIHLSLESQRQSSIRPRIFRVARYAECNPLGNFLLSPRRAFISPFVGFTCATPQTPHAVSLLLFGLFVMRRIRMFRRKFPGKRGERFRSVVLFNPLPRNCTFARDPVSSSHLRILSSFEITRRGTRRRDDDESIHPSAF